MVQKMGRTGSTYRARLVFLINTCMNLFMEEGEVNVKNLADRADLSERLVRDYIDDLTALDVLTYKGHGKYEVNLEYVESIKKAQEVEPYQFQLTEFLSPIRVKPVEDKVREVLKKANFAYEYGEELYSLLSTSAPPFDSFIGEKIILHKKAKNILLDEMYLPGSSATREKKDRSFYDFAFFTVTCICSVSYIGYFENNMLIHNKSDTIEYPRTETFTGKDPFKADEPFYELVTDFPELLSAGRSIAARFLEKIQHYKADLETVERWGDKLDILFHDGSLFPHGFFVQSRKLEELWQTAHKLFSQIKHESEKKNILWVGVVRKPQDNIYTKSIQKTLVPDLQDSSDFYLFYNLLRDRDITCLVKRGKEKGKPDVENMYEFYLKRAPEVVRLEFFSLGDPLIEQETIANIVHTLFIPEKRGSIYGPSSMVTAQDLSQNLIRTISNIVTTSLRRGYQDYISELRTRSRK